MKLCYSDNLDLRCAKNMSLYSLYLTQLRTADFLLKLLADQINYIIIIIWILTTTTAASTAAITTTFVAVAVSTAAATTTTTHYYYFEIYKI